MVGDPINIHAEMWLITLKLSLIPGIYVQTAKARLRSNTDLSGLWLFAYMNMIITFFWLEGPLKYTYKK